MIKTNRAIVYRLYPNKKQAELFQKTFGCVRFVYNQMLSIQEERYKSNESHLSKFDMNLYCNRNLKIEYAWLKEVDKFALTNAIYHLEDSYQRMFRHLSKHPKYKNKHKAKKSYTTNFTNNNIEVGENYIKLPKVGKVKAKKTLDADSFQIMYNQMVEVADGLGIEAKFPMLLNTLFIQGSVYFTTVSDDESLTIETITLPEKYCRKVGESQYGTTVIQFDFSYFTNLGLSKVELD